MNDYSRIQKTFGTLGTVLSSVADLIDEMMEVKSKLEPLVKEMQKELFSLKEIADPERMKKLPALMV